MGDEFAGRNRRESLSAYAECAGCEEEHPVMVTPEGYYCWECVPEDQLDNVLNAIHRGF